MWDGYSVSETCEEGLGKSLVKMLLKNNRDALFIMKNDLGEFEIINYDIYYEELESEVSAAASGINDRSVFMLDEGEDKTILYYTDGGNNIFRYNYISEGNFPESSDYTVGNEGDVIQSMLMDPDGEKLYVAVNAKEGDYRGCVYCYDCETGELLWKERGVAGEIVQMIYKDK